MVNKISLNIYGMSCVSCAKNIEGFIKKEKGVYDIVINFSNSKAYITYDDELVDPSVIVRKIKELGYSASFEYEDENALYRGFKRKVVIAAISALALFPFSMLKHIHFVDLHLNGGYSLYLEFILTSVILIAGFDFFKNGIWHSLIKNRVSNMYTLISIGAGSAYIASIFGWIYKREDMIYFESAGYIIAFVMIGKFLEFKSKKLSVSIFRSLFFLKPKTATVLEKDAEIKKDVEMIKKDEKVIVRAGEKIPVDGVVVDGYAVVDESFINGELMVEKKVGDEVFAGSINRDGRLIILSQRDGKSSFIDSVISLIEQTYSTRPTIWHLADKISSYFVPATFIISLSSFIYWYLSGYGFSKAFMIMISVMVVACPCAFGLAIPLVVTNSVLRMSKENILVKTPSFFELINDIDVVVFDKTGTLTEGALSVVDIFTLIDKNDFLKISSSLEKNSTHPLSYALVNKYKEIGGEFYDVADFREFIGKGVSGVINGKRYFLGSLSFVTEKNVEIDKLIYEKSVEFQKRYKKIVYLFDERSVLGIVAFSDDLREDAYDVVSYFKRIKKKIVILTGDKLVSLPAKLIDGCEVYRGVLPDKKKDIIEDLINNGYKVLMIGDGINDAAALKRANLSISFGNASDLAFESADLIILKNKLSDIIKVFEFSRHVFKKIKQNLFWAFFYNILAIPIASGVFLRSYGIILKPEIASLLMSLSSITVVLNSLTILYWRFKR